MKILKLSFLLLISSYSFCQESKFGFLLNNGIVTCYDNNENINYAISFKGDTVFEVEDIQNVFVIDSFIIQPKSNPIPDKMINFQYDPVLESKLLLYFKDLEFEYQKKQLFKKKIKCEYEFFNNKFSKKFLLWYYKLPVEKNKDNGKTFDIESILSEEKNVEYQIYFLFTTNKYVTMINIPLFAGENLNYKIEKIKTEIANSVRNYAANINLNALSSQIKNQILKKPFIINDTNLKIQFTIPFWLNILKNNRYDLFAVFPDIYNVSNSLLMTFFEKSKFDSFSAFENKMIKNENVKSYEKISSSNDKMTRYKTVYITKGNEFSCQYIFINLSNHFGVINFTATKNTYDKNIEKLNEFVDGIIIK